MFFKFYHYLIAFLLIIYSFINSSFSLVIFLFVSYKNVEEGFRTLIDKFSKLISDNFLIVKFDIMYIKYFYNIDLLILLFSIYKYSEEDSRELMDILIICVSNNLFICKFIAVDIYLLLVCFFHSDLCLFIISLFFVVIYLLSERFKDIKEQVGIDVCIVPVITTIFAGVFSFYANNISVSSSFLPFYNVSTHLSLSSEPKGILSFLTLHIAACVGWVTFWAFWSQIKANALTVENFEKQQITEQYFEMMKMHLDNVKGFSLKFKSDPNVPGFIDNVEIVNGIDIFDSLKQNYEIIFREVKGEIHSLINAALLKKENKLTVNDIYLIKYKDVKNFSSEDFLSVTSNDDIPNILKEKKLDVNKILWFQLQIHILKNTYYFIYEHNTELNDEPSSYDSRKNKFIIKLSSIYGLGYKNKLTHYYRNLFKTVKYIATQDEDLFNYEGKKDKLRMLRSQMNNTEQLMLFYNWISSYGGQWENAWKKEKDKKNKFLTDYRMIHNLHYDDLDKTIFEGFDEETKKHLLIFLFENLGSIFCDSKKCNYKAKNYNKDLFEFEDWD